MVMRKLANEDFERAVAKAFRRKVISWLTRRSNELLPFDAVRDTLPIKGQHHLGLKQVEINLIVGSLGRYRDFDRAFLPTQSRTKGRWVSVDQAHYESIKLPPVELYKIGDIFFVRDGNHRVSVARERGQEFIDAYVTEIVIPVPLTANTDVDDLVVKQEYAHFLEITHLDKTRPVANLETRVGGQYQRLLEHIGFHRWLLGQRQQGEISMEEAATSWYDHVYIPLIEAIREQGLMKKFPDSSEPDLYLWLITYQWYLRMAYKDESPGDSISSQAAKQEAGKQLTGDEHQSDVRKLVQVLKKADWVDEFVLRQERATFFQETQLAQLRPEAQIEATVPGQYERLSEQIAVHRWYLGEQRHAEVPYSEAVISWYDHVYLPLVELIRGQNILEQFPGRTETDLYLWVIEEQAYLRAEYGSEVSLEEAARQLADGHTS
jgi:hypothetical protein